MLISKEKYDELKSKEDLTDEEKQLIADYEAVEFEEADEPQPKTQTEPKEVLIEDKKKLSSKVKQRNDDGEEAKEQLDPLEDEPEDDKKSNTLLYVGVGVVLTGALAYILLREDKRTENGADVEQQKNEPKTGLNGFNNCFTS